MGTNLREPVPADPLKVPQFIPVEHATRAERSATSAALIEEAGTSTQRLGVPLTLQDFPREQVNHKGEDTMHLSVPLFGLGAPRWRTAEGLSDHDEPGTASYDGVRARPLGNRGLKQWDSAKKKKMKRKPLFKLVEEGTDPYGIGVPTPSGSSISRAGSIFLEAPDGPVQEPRGSSSSFDSSASPLDMTDLHTPSTSMAAAGSVPSSAPAHTGLSRSSTMATVGSTTTTQTEPPSPMNPPLRRSGAMAHIGPEPEYIAPVTETTLESALYLVRATNHRAATERKEKDDKAKKSTGDVDVGSTTTTTTTTTATTSSLSRTSTMTTIGSSPQSPVSRPATTAKIAKARSIKSTSKANKAKAKTAAAAVPSAGPQRRKRASAASTSTAATASASSATPPTSNSTAPSRTETNAPRRTLKRARRTADDEDEQQQGDEEEQVDGEPPRKRIKRATAPSPGPTVGGGGRGGGGRRRGRGSAVKVEADDGAARAVEHASSSSRSQQGQVRRSTRVTRASAAAAAATAEVGVPAPAAPARRGQAAKGKKAKKN
jgi:hypothetical protein